jgi:hypothetical protein
LLILTIFIGIALIQKGTVPLNHQLQIQLQDHNLFWAISNDGKIVLSKQPTMWVIDTGSIQISSTTYIIAVNSNNQRAQHIQFNGVGKQFTTVTDNTPIQAKQLFILFKQNNIADITPSSDRSSCITYKEMNVVAEEIKTNENWSKKNLNQFPTSTMTLNRN